MSKTILAAALAVALGVGAISGWWLGSSQKNDGAASAGQTPSERKVLYWYDPMKPDTRFDKPGKSPFMDMDLVPRYADEEGVDGGKSNPGVKIDPVLTQNMGVKYASVTEGTLGSALEIAGSVTFNDRDVAIVQARTGGIVERAYPLAVGDVVRAGAPLADVRVPEWLAAQNEYLVLRSDKQLAGAAKSRLLQLGMSAGQIDALDRRGRPLAVVTITSPRTGMVAELNVRQGMVLASAQTLARINGLSTVWIEAEVPEAQAAALQLGSPVSALFPAWPEQPLSGKVTSLVPELNKDTRTVRVRVEVPNKNGQLRPGMYARVTMQNSNASKPGLLVPSEAVIATGQRNVVIVASSEGRFLPAEIKIGREQGGQTEILSGLKKGEKIVVSGQFMIDSEASLRGVLARMDSSTSQHENHATTPPTYEGVAIVKTISEKEVTLAHEPIPALKWPSMTMPFPLAKPGLANTFKAGDKVRFSFIQNDDGAIVQSMTKYQGGAK